MCDAYQNSGRSFLLSSVELHADFLGRKNYTFFIKTQKEREARARSVQRRGEECYRT